MNSTIIGALLSNPSVLIGKFIAEPLAGAVLVYGLVWLAMRPKDGRKIGNPFMWHSIGIATTVIGSSIFRIVAMVTFAGRSAYEPAAEGGGSGFYMLIVPAVVAAGYIAWLKRKSGNNMIFCSQCGARSDVAAKFCKNCGNAISNLPGARKGMPIYATLPSDEDCSNETREYLGTPIRIDQYLSKYRTTKQAVEKAISIGSIKGVTANGWLWVQDKRIQKSWW